MLEQLTRKLIGVSKAAGISIRLLPDNAVQATLCLLENKKGIVSIAKTIDDAAIDRLHEWVEQDVPVVIVIDGRGVLHKKLESDDAPSGSQLLAKVLPQVKASDFYVQRHTAGPLTFASLVRVQLLNELLLRFKEQKLDVVNVYQGPFVASIVLPFISPAIVQTLMLDKEVLEISEGNISAYHAAVAPTDIPFYKIGDEQVPPAHLLSYAAALSFLLGIEPQQAVDGGEGVAGLREDWEQKRIFKKAGVGVLAFLFLLLLINAGLFMTFSNTNHELSVFQSRGHSSLKELSQLKETVKKYKSFVAVAGWDKTTPVWYFADRLAASLTDEIYLTDLYLHPMDEAKAKEDHKTIFRYTTVSVKGMCQKPALLNEWLKNVKQLEWVQEVNKQAYHYNEREKTGFFSFEIITKDID
jgi:hypothetical protein